eukprot:Sspe_Gene.44967::Locus_22129_Transcript_1_1_Confidence_1.000_Length_458::g.44967::m.44967/K01136/IDS; iduronate 2-sulfatase
MWSNMPCLLAPLLFLAASYGCAAADPRFSVLFCIVDDLRPELAGAYKQSHAITPHLDAFAKESLVFDRAYVQVAVCAPSRNSFMSGREPEKTRAYNFIDHFREAGIGENWTALPEAFKKEGYVVLGMGKTYHPGLPPN